MIKVVAKEEKKPLPSELLNDKNHNTMIIQNMTNDISINFAHMISNLALDDKDKIVKHFVHNFLINNFNLKQSKIKNRN